MTTDLIDWNLERAAKEAWYANTWTGHPRESSRRERSAMHLACANALIETRTQIGLLDEVDAAVDAAMRAS